MKTQQLTTLQQWAVSPQAVIDSLEASYSKPAPHTRFELVTHIGDDSDYPVRMSGLGKCPRQVATILARKDEDKWFPAHPTSRRKWERGHQRETALLDRLERILDDGTDASVEMSVSRQMELKLPLDVEKAAITRISKQWPDATNEIFGHLDFYAWDGSAGILIDVKSVASYTFSKLEKEGPSEGYVLQLAAYREALRQAGHQVDATYLLYEAADSMDLACLPVAEDCHGLAFDAYIDNMADIIEGRLDTPVYANFLNKPVHKGAQGCLPWQCSYCKVGPITGDCVSGRTVTNIAGPNAKVPKWEVS